MADCHRSSHFVSVKPITRKGVDELFRLAGHFEASAPASYASMLRGVVFGMAFYQPSTRTRLGFESAAQRLGATCVGFSDVTTTRAGDFYAETLEDTVRTLAQLVDVIVLRHHESGAAERAATLSPAPIVNAGDGYNEHPTQALGDVWTMHRLLGGLDGASVGLIGDPTIRSLRPISIVLSRFQLRELLFLTAPGTDVPRDVRGALAAARVPWRAAEHVAELLASCDVVETIGVRHPDHNLPHQDPLAHELPTPERYRIDADVLRRAGRHVAVLHPGARKDELDPAVDGLPAAQYFRQVRNNLWMKVAVLASLLVPDRTLRDRLDRSCPIIAAES